MDLIEIRDYILEMLDFYTPVNKTDGSSVKQNNSTQGVEINFGNFCGDEYEWPQQLKDWDWVSKSAADNNFKKQSIKENTSNETRTFSIKDYMRYTGGEWPPVNQYKQGGTPQKRNIRDANGKIAWQTPYLADGQTSDFMQGFIPEKAVWQNGLPYAVPSHAIESAKAEQLRKAQEDWDANHNNAVWHADDYNIKDYYKYSGSRPMSWEGLRYQNADNETFNKQADETTLMGMKTLGWLYAPQFMSAVETPNAVMNLAGENGVRKTIGHEIDALGSLYNGNLQGYAENKAKAAKSGFGDVVDASITLPFMGSVGRSIQEAQAAQAFQNAIQPIGYETRPISSVYNDKNVIGHIEAPKPQRNLYDVMFDENGNPRDFLTKEQKKKIERDVAFRKMMIDAGFDPVTGNRIPRQIKLADEITYDDNGRIIPLSIKDNYNKNDIRYKSLMSNSGSSENRGGVIGLFDRLRGIINKERVNTSEIKSVLKGEFETEDYLRRLKATGYTEEQQRSIIEKAKKAIDKVKIKFDTNKPPKESEYNDKDGIALIGIKGASKDEIIETILHEVGHSDLSVAELINYNKLHIPAFRKEYFNDKPIRGGKAKWEYYSDPSEAARRAKAVMRWGKQNYPDKTLDEVYDIIKDKITKGEKLPEDVYDYVYSYNEPKSAKEFLRRAIAISTPLVGAGIASTMDSND
ncbi:MAG: hypothetical protein J6Y82_04225 [Bacteroidales bacterium]|nr:hypothetical protein [Bacteroidales bacterium]